MVDTLTKYVWAEPIPNQEADTVLKAFLKIFAFGAPKEILMDQGVQFMSKLYAAMCTRLGVTQLFMMAFHLQGDGQTEHMNQTLIHKVFKAVAPTGDDWDRLLPLILMAYNSEKHSTIKESPFYLLFQQEPNLPSDNPMTIVPALCAKDDWDMIAQQCA